DTEKNQAAMGNRAGGAAGRGMGAAPADMTVVQDDKTLKVTQSSQNGDVTRTYNLDGSETTVKDFRGNDAKATAKWNGDKLVITTTSQGQNGPMSQVVTWYLDGQELVLERQFAGRNGGEATTVKTYYKKK